MKQRFLSLMLVCVAGFLARGAVVYENNFEKMEAGAVPEEKDKMLVLDGGFAVREEGGNKFLELPGAPLETFGVLFGTAQKENIVVQARVLGTGKGRRFPTFGLGAGGQGGYRLVMAGNKKLIELYKGDTLKASVPAEWTSGKWAHLKLQVRRTGETAWSIEGRVWPEGGKEPEAATIRAEEKQDLPTGRASIWGLPFAGTPIRFDDLTVSTLDH